MFHGCKRENEIIISQPLILIKNEAPKVADTIVFKVFEYANSDNNRITPTRYNWKILDDKQNVLNSNFKDSLAVTWIPDSAGHYVISTQVLYGKGKSGTAFMEIDIFENAHSLQKKLSGKWYGDVLLDYGEVSYVEVTFNEDGHYVGTSHSYVDGSVSMDGPFGRNSYVVDGNYSEQPSDLPCNKFLISYTNGNRGYGGIYGSSEYRYGRDYQYYCGDSPAPIIDLELVNSNKGLLFSSDDRKYDLTRDGYPRPEQNYTVEDFVGRYKGEAFDGASWLPQYWLDITKSSNEPNKIVLGCFPNLCFSIEANISKNTISIPETTFKNIPSTSHGGSMVDYYYDEVVSGSGIFYQKVYLQIDYTRKTITPSVTFVETGRLNLIKQH